MRILVLGGTRFIGRAVVDNLLAKGHDVTVFHRGETGECERAGEAHMHGDRRRLAQYRPAFERLAPEVVIDMRMMTPAEAQAVIAVFKGLARRLVVASSVDVYRAFEVFLDPQAGPLVPTPLAEDSPLRHKRFPYRQEPPRAADDPERWRDDYDKIPVEEAVLNEPALPGTVLRLPFVYGPRDYQHRVYPYLRRMDAGRPVILLDEAVAAWRSSRAHVANVAEAIALAATDARAAGRLYNVAETALSEAEWVEAIAQAAGWTGHVQTAPASRLPEPLRWPYQMAQPLVADASRLRRELDYREVMPLAEGLRETLAWERAHPPAPDSPFYGAQTDAEEEAFLAQTDHQP